MPTSPRGLIQTTEVWAQLFLCDADCARISDFFVSAGLKKRCVVRRMHLTVYHSRRPLPGVVDVSEPVSVVLAAAGTRFMVLAPGGENPRTELEPGKLRVGIRVQKQNATLSAILQFRDRMLRFETPRVLGSRAPSTRNNNAFGARNYQPYVALLRPGSKIDRDLTSIGSRFREALVDLTFDRFAIEVVSPGVRSGHS